MTNYIADNLAVPTGGFLDANMSVDVSRNTNGEGVLVDIGPETLIFNATFIGRYLAIQITNGEDAQSFEVEIPATDTEDHLVSGLSFAGKTLTISASDGSSYDVVLPLNYDEHSFTGDGTTDSPLEVSGEAVLEQTVGFTLQDQPPSVSINKTDRINETFTTQLCLLLPNVDGELPILHGGILTGTVSISLTNSTLTTLQSSRIEVLSVPGNVVLGTQDAIFGGTTPISITLNNLDNVDIHTLCLRWIGIDSRIFSGTVSVFFPKHST